MSVCRQELAMSSTELISTARGMVPDLSKAMPVVYFLRLRSGMLYVGASVDLEQRLDDHVSGQACRTTQLDPLLALLRIEVCSTFREARQREAQLKRWSRRKKETLIRVRTFGSTSQPQLTTGSGKRTWKFSKSR